MATGHYAFSGRTTGVILDAILNREPKSPRKSNQQVLPELEQIIDKALGKTGRSDTSARQTFAPISSGSNGPVNQDEYLAWHVRIRGLLLKIGSSRFSESFF
jgi:hypothetical protein